MNNFMSILDNSEVVKKKRIFYEKFHSSGTTLGDLLKKYLHYEVKCLMDACLSVEEMAFKVQESEFSAQNRVNKSFWWSKNGIRHARRTTVSLLEKGSELQSPSLCTCK